MKAITSIHTDDAKRIAKRLLNHWKHKFEVSEQEQLYTIFMPDTTVKLIAKSAALDIELDSTLDDLKGIQDVVIAHLNRMAQQEFHAQWHTIPAV